MGGATPLLQYVFTKRTGATLAFALPRVSATGHAQCMVAVRNAHRLLIGRREGKMLPGRPRRKLNLQKWDMTAFTGYIWQRMAKCDGLL
jgi:hypothetical protein